MNCYDIYISDNFMGSNMFENLEIYLNHELGMFMNLEKNVNEKVYFSYNKNE